MTTSETQLPSTVTFLTALLTSLSTITAQNVISNNISAFPSAARRHLQTLHVLFPHCLLDALDVLDRSLVTRLIVLPREAERSGSSLQGIKSHPAHSQNGGRVEYYVRSSRQVSNYQGNINKLAEPMDPMVRMSSNQPIRTEETYHVHLAAWNCSCAAFAFAAYTSQGCHRPLSLDADGSGGVPVGNRFETSWQDEPSAIDGVASLSFGMFGGLAAHSMAVPPTCKHLLACVLAEACPSLFGVAVKGATGEEERGSVEHGQRGVVEQIIGLNGAAGWAGGGGGF